MPLGPYCSALGIDEEVLNGQKTLTVPLSDLSNGVMWEIRKYKIAKKCSVKDIVDWLINIFQIKCENNTDVQSELNDKFDNLSILRGTLIKSPRQYKGEVERLMKWPFDLPSIMVTDPVPKFEPTVRANLGPKLLKVLKEKAGDDEDSIDMSGPSDDDDDEAKRRKAREEIIQLKKDLGSARKIITALNDRLNDLSNRCQLLNDMSKSSVSERRRIESDVSKLKVEWNNVISIWHDCIERLNYVNNNKGNYLDVGYMVRRNKTKQGIFDELNWEFERTVEDFKHTVTSLIDKERRKKKSASREARQKNKTDKKRIREESTERDDNKKICLSEEANQETQPEFNVDEFLKSEKVEEFKGGRYINALKAIYQNLSSMVIPCHDVHEIIYSVLSELEDLKADKIPSQAFAGNILMEARMLATLQAYSEHIKMSKISICNDSVTKFTLKNSSYDVLLQDETQITLGVRDIADGSPDTSLNMLKDIFGDLMNIKADGNSTLETLVNVVKTSVIEQHLLDKTFVEILFLYKQQLLPKLKPCLDSLGDSLRMKILTLNNFCTGLYFLLGLAELADVTVLAWELMSHSANTVEVNKVTDTNQILSKTIQHIYSFCQYVHSQIEGNEDCSVEFSKFLQQEKSLDRIPLAPSRGNLFNIIFHNSAGLWFFHEIGALSEFFEKVKDENKATHLIFNTVNEKQHVSVARALGLLGKLVAVPMWTVLEDYDIVQEISMQYATLLEKVENWGKDASKFMKGQERLFDDVPVSHDAVYVSLIKDNEAHDALTKELLELIFTAYVPYIRNFLYGNSKNFENNNVNSDVTVDVSNLPINTAIHKDFSIFDRITKNMHLASTFALDALMQYSKTKNGEWQDKLCSKNNLRVFELIRYNSSKQLKWLYKRKIMVNELKNNAKEQKNKDISRCQKIEKKYKLIDDLIKWGGLWKSEKEIDDQLNNMKENDRMSALKSQIKFRRHVLDEVHEDGLLDLASEGECFNASKLYENLKAVLRKEFLQTETDVFELSSASDNESVRAAICESCKKAEEKDNVQESSKSFISKENFHWLLGKLIDHVCTTEDGNKNALIGICIARKKANGVYSYFVRYKDKEGVCKYSESKIAEDYQNGALRVIDPSAKELVGSKLSRAFFKDDGELEWYDCHVIDIITGGENPEFAVEYDFYGSDLELDDSQNHIPELETLTFSSHLLEDYRNDRLRLV